jgi:hypothetical protein
MIASAKCSCPAQLASGEADVALVDPVLLADLLRQGHAGEPWHGPGMQALLRDLSAAEAAARPVGQAHSIWELVLHMTGWQSEVLRRLRGGEPALPADGDWPAVADHGPAAWDAARVALAASLAELADAVEHLAGERPGRWRGASARRTGRWGRG